MMHHNDITRCNPVHIYIEIACVQCGSCGSHKPTLPPIIPESQPSAENASRSFFCIATWCPHVPLKGSIFLRQKVVRYFREIFSVCQAGKVETEEVPPQNGQMPGDGFEVLLFVEVCFWSHI